MGGLFLVRDRYPGFTRSAMENARTQFAKQGFSQMSEKKIRGWRILHASYILGGPPALVEIGEDFALMAGTLTFNGEQGRSALAALLTTSTTLPNFDWSLLGGQFSLLLHKDGRTFLATDFFGAHHLYHDVGRRLFSTSLLAAATALPRVTLSHQGVYEYAFQCSVLGNDTVLEEIKRVDPTQVMELTRSGSSIHFASKPLPSRPTDTPLAERIACHRALLHEVVGSYVRYFGNDIHCPLSGGLDSRLVLAVLRSLGCRPQVYVYGPANHPDVIVARQIGKAEGFPVEWIEKDRYKGIEPDEFPERVARNFQENDGLPNFGCIFDNGGNSFARHSRHRTGALAVSGGCGEIYRNFFFLPDRPLRVSALTDCFFSRFDTRDTTDEFNARVYRGAIESKILEALERPGDHSKLPRSVVEQIYPRVRGRSLFGREISIEARYSPYMMPFLDHRIVAEAIKLPMPLKNAGEFEARLLNSIDPSLARRQSNYGHNFAMPPNLRHKFSEWSTQVRPFWLRRRSYAIQRRVRYLADEHGGLLGPEYLGQVIDLEFPVMRRYFCVQNISDSGLLRRVACLEYFAGYIGGRLVVP